MSSYYEKVLATGEVKCIDEEIPFEIPQGWEWCRLNDLALYRKGPFGSSLTKSMFVAKSNQSVKVYEQKNAIQKDFRLGDYYISKEKFEAMQSFIVKPNDIIVSCAGTIGETYLLPLDAPVGIINQALMRVTLFDLSMEEYWQMYFAYMLLNEAQMKGAGSAIKNIPPFEYLKAVLVPVPPLSEQTRLIERYNLLLSLIAKYESEADKLNCLNQNIYDKLKKSVLQEAIQGKLVQQIAEEGTAQELLEQIKTEKQKLVKEGKLKKSALATSAIFRGDDNRYYEQIGKKCVDITEQLPFDLPNNWTWCRLGNLVSITSGENLTSKQMHNGKIPVFGGNGITGYHSKANIFEETIVIGRVGYYCGSIHLTPCQAWVTDNAFITQYSKLLNRDFLIYLLTALNLGKCCNATAQPVVSGKKIYPLLIALPPFKEQQRIVAQIEKLFEQLR